MLITTILKLYGKSFFRRRCLQSEQNRTVDVEVNEFFADSSVALAFDSSGSIVYSPRWMTDIVDSPYMIWHFCSEREKKHQTSERHSLRGDCWLSDLIVLRSIVFINNNFQTNQNDFHRSIGCWQNYGRIRKEWIQFWKLSTVSFACKQQTEILIQKLHCHIVRMAT